ncbi:MULTISPECIES: DegT/DnrJ/EryC1/StrS family aminotransferase [Primorskyibacter]|uniref:DegT/DnrJ/EryC1/StrS family aminotransferase n=1 Tax=Primorskyibacter TaxID=1068904 RepID=UPI000E30431C|nr:DegT/DnrJ/EryC1/StrS family aminotransferase [Primorskyibacter marinus]
MPENIIYVTCPTLPPRADVISLLDEIWDRRFVTNFGPVHQRFEAALAAYLDVPYVTVTANATLGCMLALRHLGVSGEVITPAFSFVATAHAARWVGADLVFADIDPETLSVDPEDVERRITPKTRAIFAVHCYANPCDTRALADIAERHGLALIYDAAHCFAAKDEGGSLLRHGDLSVVSFHATKVFNTLEGGAIISHDPETKQALDRLCNYGILDENNIESIGLNAKMSEMHAAVGLAQLPHVEHDIARRGQVVQRYWDRLKDMDGIRCICPPDRPGRNNYAFPILIGPDYPLPCMALHERLKAAGIHARRYFHPPLSQLLLYRDLPSADPQGLPCAIEASEQVLCLPLYPDLAPQDQDRVLDVICNPAGLAQEAQDRVTCNPCS